MQPDESTLGAAVELLVKTKNYAGIEQLLAQVCECDTVQVIVTNYTYPSYFVCSVV